MSLCTLYPIVGLICSACNLILALRGQVTRFGFQAFVFPLMLLPKGGVALKKTCACARACVRVVCAILAAWS